MKLFAEEKELKLSENGLVPMGKVAAAKGAKATKEPGIPCETEIDIFKALGLPYKTPAERDI